MLILLLLFLKSGNCSIVSGTIVFSDGPIADSIIITVDSYYYSGHVVYSKQSDQNFAFDLEPGKYQLSIQSEKTSVFSTHLLIDDQNREILFNITLSPKGQESTSKVTGFKFHDQYNSIVNELNIFNKMFFSVNPGNAIL